MRKVAILVLSLFLFAAQEVEITAKRFEADRQKRVAKFFGNVIFKRGKDLIQAKKAFIYFDKNRKPVKFHAIGDVRFRVSDKEKIYKGRCQELIYYPKKKIYVFIKNVFIQQLPDGKKVYAERVVLDMVRGSLKVEGRDDRPVKLIFKVEE